jgi:hypothetical protein
MVGGLRRDRIRSQRERQGLEKRAMKVSQWREAARSATGSNDRIPIQFGHEYNRKLHAVALGHARASRIPAAAAIGTRDDFEQMPIRILEVETAPTVVVVGLPRLSLAGVSPVRQVPLADAAEYLFEFGVADQEGVMLGHDLAFGIHIVEIGVVVGRDHVERPPAPRRRQPQHLGQEICRGLAVSSRQNRMIEMDCHTGLSATT